MYTLSSGFLLAPQISLITADQIIITKTENIYKRTTTHKMNVERGRGTSISDQLGTRLLLGSPFSAKISEQGMKLG